MVSLGNATPGSRLHLSDAGSWLANAAKGSLTHVNGLAGRADAAIRLRDASGHPLKVVQEGETVIVVDLVTGQVSRIDAAQLDVAQQVSFGAADVDVVAGKGVMYALDPSSGSVQRVDPHTLATIGTPLTLPAPLGRAGIDSQGRLWVPLPATGQVVPVRDGVGGAPITVGGKRDAIALTLAAGTPVVSNASTATMIVIEGRSGGQRRINLPAAVRSQKPLRVPAQTAASLVPAVAATGQVIVADIAKSSVSVVSLDASVRAHLGTPQALGTRVYIPNEAAGSVLVYNTAAGRLEDRIPVSGHAGPLELSIKDDMLWANDQDGANAVVVDSSGHVRHVSKYATDTPGGHHTATTSEPPVAQPNVTTPPQTGAVPPSTVPPAGPSTVPTRPQGVTTTSSSPSPTTSTVVPPQAPGSVTATSGPGHIDVAFTPSSGQTPDHYELAGAPAGATVSPAKVAATGPFSFRVSGLNCGSQYSFRVVAVSASFRTSTGPTTPMRPCVPPGTPGNLTLAPFEHGMNVSWAAASDGGAPSLTYTVSWPGGSQPGIGGLSTTINGLTNGQTYDVSVSAVNAAGSSQAPAVASATLTPPPGTYNNYNHFKFTVRIRSGPHQTDAQVGSLPTVPSGQLGAAVTVHCQAAGDSVADPVTPSERTSVWDKVTYNGTVGYVLDLYVSTRNSLNATFSSPELWSCA